VRYALSPPTFFHVTTGASTGTARPATMISSPELAAVFSGGGATHPPSTRVMAQAIDEGRVFFSIFM
jgi:hypothetical protein